MQVLGCWQFLRWPWRRVSTQGAFLILFLGCYELLLYVTCTFLNRKLKIETYEMISFIQDLCNYRFTSQWQHLFIRPIFIGCQFYGEIKKTNNLKRSKRNKAEGRNPEEENRPGGTQRTVCSWPQGGIRRDFLEEAASELGLEKWRGQWIKDGHIFFDILPLRNGTFDPPLNFPRRWAL